MIRVRDPKINEFVEQCRAVGYPQQQFKEQRSPSEMQHGCFRDLAVWNDDTIV